MGTIDTIVKGSEEFSVLSDSLQKAIGIILLSTMILSLRDFLYDEIQKSSAR